MTIRSDVVAHPDFAIGWQRDIDFVEGILVVAALELQARRRISMSSPFDERVCEHLGPRFRYDPFAFTPPLRIRCAYLTRQVQYDR